MKDYLTIVYSLDRMVHFGTIQITRFINTRKADFVVVK